MCVRARAQVKWTLARTEASAAARVTVHHDARGDDVAVRREDVEQVAVRGVVGDVEHEQVAARSACTCTANSKHVPSHQRLPSAEPAPHIRHACVATAATPA